jgi:OmpA-OmpF porin, OOP family
MTKSMRFVLFIVAMSVCAGCGIKQPAPLFEQSALSTRLQAGEYIQKADNFLILFDTSRSMRHIYNGKQKFYWAQSVAYGLNDTIADLPLNGGLRTFGNLRFLSATRTTIVCPMQTYSSASYRQCLDRLKPSSGNTPIYEALMAADDDIENISGRTAIIIISDGDYNTQSPMPAITTLKEKYGDNVCISTIAIGRDAGMETFAADSPCGAAAHFNDVTTAAGMADFVTQVFFEKKPERTKPAPAPVAAPAPAVKKEKIILSAIMFDFDSSAIKPEFAAVLQEAAEILKQRADTSIIIEGHTCSIGTAQYNQGLSERRAAAVKKYLTAQGIAASRFTTKGVGENQPIADNTTIDGRKRNRRVEFHVMH